MADVFDKRKRSEVMSRIPGRGNKATELALAAAFRTNGITGWRRNQSIFGKPDFVFLPRRVVVFVDGCFWHSCPRHCKMPAGNASFWRNKLSRNKARDLLVNRTLRSTGWVVVRIWECALEKALRLKKPELVLRRIRRALDKGPDLPSRSHRSPVPGNRITSRR